MTTTAVRARLIGLDVLRGLAILAMVVDHLTIVLDGPDFLRYTVGRLALPLFFLVAGSLVSTTLRKRYALIALLGAGLPLVVPWVDSPNVLWWYVMGVLVMYRMPHSWTLPALVVSVVLLANGLLWAAGGYPFAGILALMLLGRLIGSHQLDDFAARSLGRLGLPYATWVGYPLAVLGRHPLAFYVGHLLVLGLVFRV